ncbi:restriction endonuclease subunit R [Baaleninema sp.]|uniref:restriction endonuclease subunit R n=1 Tax=Baaleninema sp. TaxID=3101197 RepID=UPI003D0130F2
MVTRRILAQKTNLRELIETFHLELVEDEAFFSEWQTDLPELSDTEKQLLDKVKAGYLNLLNYPPLLEDVVRMSVLDPILFIGDFYLQPFYVRSEEPIEFLVEDEDTLVKGRIDTLVLKDKFWVMAIESKKASFSIEEGLAQLIAYMMGNPHPERPVYGLISTGGSFAFIKLLKSQAWQYAVSKVFITRNPGNELYTVLQILKHLSRLIIEE